MTPEQASRDVSAVQQLAIVDYKAWTITIYALGREYIAVRRDEAAFHAYLACNIFEQDWSLFSIVNEHVYFVRYMADEANVGVLSNLN